MWQILKLFRAGFEPRRGIGFAQDFLETPRRRFQNPATATVGSGSKPARQRFSR